MLHANGLPQRANVRGSLVSGRARRNGELRRAIGQKKSRRSDLRLNGDEVTYVFTQTLRRATRPTNFALSEPRYKQDLSANPYRTAPTLFTVGFDLVFSGFVQNKSINENHGPAASLDQPVEWSVIVALE
jgi:hypothetical protein